MHELIRQHHLRVLQLGMDASDADIRRAYRRLSKKYHPDLNTNPEAVERFIEIKEAYDYLLDIHNKAEPYVVSSAEDIREQWKAEARAHAKRKAQQEALFREKMMVRIHRYVNPLIWVITAFNLLLAVDYILPRDSYFPETFRIEQYSTADILFTNRYIIEFHEETFGSPLIVGNLEIRTTPILKNFVEVHMDLNGKSSVIYPEVGVYAFFGYLIPFIFLVAAIYFRAGLGIENKLTLSFFLVLLAIIQLVLNSRYG